MDYGNRRNAVVSTVSGRPNEDKRQRWRLVDAHDLGLSVIFRMARMLVGFRLFPKPAPRDISDFGSVIYFDQLVRDSFVATAGRQEQWPSWIKFLCLHCDASSMTATGVAQEAVVPVRGFLQTTQSKIRKWEMWLPSPWDVRPMRG